VGAAGIVAPACVVADAMFEYPELTEPFEARTWYRYVVDDARPMF